MLKPEWLGASKNRKTASLRVTAPRRANFSTLMYRSLDSEKIVDTIDLLRRRIEERFPESGLGKVCRELLTIARESQERSAWIARPHKALRVITWLVLIVGSVIN